MQKGIFSILSERAVRMFKPAPVRSVRPKRTVGQLRKFEFKKDPVMEAEYGRRIFGRSNEERRKRLWDAEDVKREMAGSLRPGLRKEEAERIQEAARKRSERNALLYTATKRLEFNILVAFLNNIEKGAYANLRHPENRKAMVSNDYFNGFQNGTIEVVEIIRNMYVQAALQYKNELRSKTRTIQQQEGHSEESR